MDETTEPTGTPAPEAGGGGGNGDVAENKGIAALSYLGILCLIPLLAKRESKFAQFHAKQGLVLLIVEVIFGFLAGVLAIIPVIGWIIDVVVWLYIVIMIIMGLINSLSGKYWEMPLLGQFAKKFNF